MSQTPSNPKPIGPLRARTIEDMTVRNFTPDTQREYIRAVKKLAAFLGRSPDSAAAEELRAFQLHLSKTGTNPPTMNATVTAPRFFFQGHTGPAGDSAVSRVRARAAQTAARAAG